MSNIIHFPPININPPTRIEQTCHLAVQYASLPAEIVRNATWNRIAMNLQNRGWTLTVTPGFIQCRHPQVMSKHPVGIMEAFEIQKILDGRTKS